MKTGHETDDAGLSTARAGAAVVASACCFGAIPVFILIAIDAGATLQSGLAARFLIAGLVLFALSGRAAFQLPAARILPLLLIGGVGQLVITFFALTALRYVSAATSSFLFYTYPVWLTLGAAAFGSERITPRRIAALAIALAGIAVIVGNIFAGGLNRTGVLLALTSAFAYALYVPFMNRVQHGLPPTTVAAWVCAGAALGYLVFGVVSATLVLPTDALRGWGAILGLALISSVTGFVLFLRGLAVIGPVRTAILSTVEPFCTAVLAALFVHQPLSARTFAGGFLIAAAVTIIQWRPASPASSNQ